jgi:hypothetical protein
MSGSTSATSNGASSRQTFLRKYWWALGLIVLILLVAIIYVLSRLSAADSEMYPTTMLRVERTTVRLC